MMKRFKSTIFSLACCVLAMVSCTKERDGNNQFNRGFEARLTDAAADFESLNMTIVRVDAYIEGQGWVELNGEARAVDILDLTNGNEFMLAQDLEAEAGLYSKIRIVFDKEASLELNSLIELGEVTAGASVDLAWKGRNEVVVEIDETVNASGKTSVLLDFNVAQSIEEGQGFILDPIITEVENEKTGIKGGVVSETRVMVTVQKGNQSFTTYTDADGKFLLRGLEEGSYQVSLEATGSHRVQTFDKVAVVEGEITSMGDIQF